MKLIASGAGNPVMDGFGVPAGSRRVTFAGDADVIGAIHYGLRSWLARALDTLLQWRKGATERRAFMAPHDPVAHARDIRRRDAARENLCGQI